MFLMSHTICYSFNIINILDDRLLPPIVYAILYGNANSVWVLMKHLAKIDNLNHVLISEANRLYDLYDKEVQKPVPFWHGFKLN